MEADAVVIVCLPAPSYYCVVLQYNSKLDAEQLRRFVRDSIPESDRPSRKKFNFQHAPGEVGGGCHWLAMLPWY